MLPANGSGRELRSGVYEAPTGSHRPVLEQVHWPW
jgi:hypothetical protein